MAEFVLNGMFSSIDLQDYFGHNHTDTEIRDALSRLDSDFDHWYRALAEYDPGIGLRIEEAPRKERLSLIIKELKLPVSVPDSMDTGLFPSDTAYPSAKAASKASSEEGGAPPKAAGTYNPDPDGSSFEPHSAFGLTPEKESLIGQISSPRFLEQVRQWCHNAEPGAALILTNEELSALEEQLALGLDIGTIGLCDVILRARESFFRFHDSPNLSRQVHLIGITDSDSPVDLHFLPSSDTKAQSPFIDFRDCLFLFENIRPIVPEPDRVLLLSSFCGLSPGQLPNHTQIMELRREKRPDGKYQYLTADGKVHPIGCFDIALPFITPKTLVFHIGSGAMVIDTCGRELPEYRERFRLREVISIRTHFTGCFLLSYRNGTLALWNNTSSSLLDGVEQIDDTPSDGMFRIKRLGKWGLFPADDPAGPQTEDAFCYDLLLPCERGFAIAGIASKKGILRGVITRDSSLLVPFLYHTLRRVPYGFFCTGSRRKNWFDTETYQHFYDLSGKCYSTDGASWSKGLLRVCDDSRCCGFVDTEGKFVIPCTLTGTVYNFAEDGTALVIKDGIHTYIDTSGNLVVRQ